MSANSDREILITRVVNAPRERVWEAWTKPEQLKQWFAPMIEHATKGAHQGWGMTLDQLTNFLKK